jgi:adenylylsulfate kinase-like enzyme
MWKLFGHLPDVYERPESGEHLVLWMHGSEGTGKSAIAQSVAEYCEALLAAIFLLSNRCRMQ